MWIMCITELIARYNVYFSVDKPVQSVDYCNWEFGQTTNICGFFHFRTVNFVYIKSLLNTLKACWRLYRFPGFDIMTTDCSQEWSGGCIIIKQAGTAS